MNYTIQHTLQSGIKADVIGLLIKELQKDVVRDLKKKIPEEKIEALQKFTNSPIFHCIQSAAK